MKRTSALSVLCRLLLAIALVTSGFGAPAVAMTGTPDCMAMMDGASSEMPAKAPATHKVCPFAGLCAVAGYFVGPMQLDVSALRYPVEIATITGDDVFGAGITAPPLLRPPKS